MSRQGSSSPPAIAESNLDPNAVNKSSGAAGLYQLLSGGYRDKAQQLGGLFNVDANAQAILPQYADYFKSHPNATPGSAGAAVEASGEGSGFYSKDLGTVNKLLSSGHPQALDVAGKNSNTTPFQATEFSSPSSAPPTNPVDGSVNHSQLLQQTLLNWVSARNNATLAGKPLGGPGAVDLLGQLGTLNALGSGSPAVSGAPGGSGEPNPFAPSTTPDSVPSTPSPADPYSGKGVRTDHLVLGGGATLQGVNPTLVNDANSLAAAIGKPITVESGYRDYAKQAGLYKRYQDSGFNNAYIAAKPGTSNHERGQALDLTVGGVPIAKALSAALLRRYGLHNPVSGDLPHTTLLGVNG
jgi:hypothetical protein